MLRPGKKRKNNFLTVGISVFLLFLCMEVWAAEEMVYKPPRNPRDVSLAQDSQSMIKGQAVNPVQMKTDPFKSFLSVQENYKKKRKKKPRTYLETVDISQLDLIATILNSKGNWAMVRDAKGLGHVIRKGTLIGTNEGVVQKIREGKVFIREKHRDFMGKVKTKDIVKRLPGQQ